MIITHSFQLLLAAIVTVFMGCAAQQTSSPPGTADSPTLKKSVESSESQAIYSYLAYRELLQEKKTDEAVLALEKAISIAPTPELFLELGNLYWRSSRFSDALASLKQGLDRYPDSGPLLSTLAKTYAAQGRFDDAVLTLDEYREKHPELVDVAHEAAIYRMEQRQFGEAVDRLNAIPDDQSTPTTSFLLGKAYFGLGLFDKAIAFYQEAVASDPEFFDAWVEMGLTYETQKNYIDAEKVFTQLFETGVENQQIIFRLVDLNLKLNNPDKALEYVLPYADDQALSLEAANLFLTQNFFDHAAQLLDPIAQEKPIPANALMYLAVLEYEGRDNPDKALAYLEAIPVSHPHHERSLVFRIHLLYQKDEADAARQLSLSSIAMFPRQPEFRVILAEIYEHEKQYPKALDLLLKASSDWPENTTILYRLGLVYDRMEHRDQAMLIMEKIIAKNPEHGDALNYLGYSLAEAGKDMERAIVLIQNALKVKPANGYYVDSLAWAYFKMGKKRLAWQEIKRAVQFVDTDPVIWEHFGDIAKSLNILDEARMGYTKALELGGENANEVRAKLNALGQAQ